MTDKTLQQKLEEFPKAVWVQMHRDRMQILNHQGQVEHTVLPIQKYDHPRSIIANFEAAESTLKQLIKMQKLPWYDSNPLLLLQVKETVEGGITFVENRALRELGYNAGARNVLIFDEQGQWLNADEAATSSSFMHSIYSKILFFYRDYCHYIFGTLYAINKLKLRIKLISKLKNHVQNHSTFLKFNRFKIA